MSRVVQGAEQTTDRWIGKIGIEVAGVVLHFPDARVKIVTQAEV